MSDAEFIKGVKSDISNYRTHVLPYKMKDAHHQDRFINHFEPSNNHSARMIASRSSDTERASQLIGDYDRKQAILDKTSKFIKNMNNSHIQSSYNKIDRINNNAANSHSIHYLPQSPKAQMIVGGTAVALGAGLAAKRYLQRKKK